VEGRDYSYFSPSFQIGADGAPAGLPDNGAIGALVNNPAFRDMQRIAASHASVNARIEDPAQRMAAQ
jgi:phage I-like protein